MDFYCHDLDCEGNAVPAGDDPEHDCRFCGSALLDGDNCCIIGRDTPLSETAEVTDMAALQVCSDISHSFEGRVILVDGKPLLAGRCARCGVAILTRG